MISKYWFSMKIVVLYIVDPRYILISVSKSGGGAATVRSPQIPLVHMLLRVLRDGGRPRPGRRTPGPAPMLMPGPARCLHHMLTSSPLAHAHAWSGALPASQLLTACLRPAPTSVDAEP